MGGALVAADRAGQAGEVQQAYNGPLVVLSEKEKAWRYGNVEAALQHSPPLRVG